MEPLHISLFKKRLVVTGIFVLAVALMLQIAFTHIGAHILAAPNTETVTAPFANGPNGTTTVKTYTGSVTINVSGTGQAAETKKSDAFYIFTDNSGNPISPEHHFDFSLCINNQPVDHYVAIPLYRSDHTYQFTILVGSSPQHLAFGVCDTYTVDNTGSFTIIVKTAPTSTRSQSDIWAGYLSHNNKLNPIQYTRVDGSWKVPSEPCLSSTPDNALDIWDGLGGSSAAPLEQVGIRLVCRQGTFQVWFFYELVASKDSKPHVLVPVPSILPGDTIIASTQYLGSVSSTNTCNSDPTLGSPGGNGVYQFFFSDNRTGWSFVSDRLCGSDDPAARSSADWVVEGHETLLNFDRVDFSSCRSSNGVISAGPIVDKFTMRLHHHSRPNAFPSSLSTDGTAFTVYWNLGR